MLPVWPELAQTVGDGRTLKKLSAVDCHDRCLVELVNEWTNSAGEIAAQFAKDTKLATIQWPGGRQVAEQWMVGPYNQSIDATRQMWAFFQEHPLTRK